MRRANRRDISHSCRSAASVACCSGSIVPVLLSAPNTGLRQPQEQTAWTAPSPSCWIVVECCTTIGVLPLNDGAAHCPRPGADGAGTGGHRPGQLAGIPSPRPHDGVAAPDHARRMRDAWHLLARRGHNGGRADFRLDQNVRGDHVTCHGRHQRYLAPDLLNLPVLVQAGSSTVAFVLSPIRLVAVCSGGCRGLPYPRAA
jgi:hypothetical protein